MLYTYTLTNPSSQAMNAHYALLTYHPATKSHGLLAQFHAIDVELAPGQSITGTINSNYTNLSRMRLFWIAFDSEAERDDFFDDSALYKDDGRYNVAPDKTAQWLEEKLGITLD